jgi:hypothetical protein
MDQEPETKVCTLCNQEKPIKRFPFQYKKNYRYNQCSTCRSERRTPEGKYKKGRRAKWKELGIDITFEQYEELLKKQNNKCLICGEESKGRKLAVDHCHETGEVRGLLCGNCNQGLGLFKDDPELMQKAAEYVYTARAKAATSSPKR